jgi:O-glycosyl hydrolase
MRKYLLFSIVLFSTLWFLCGKEAYGASSIVIDSSQVRQNIDGIGGNYPFGYHDGHGNPAVARYTMDNLKPSHVRVFFNSAGFETSNDDGNANNFNWAKFSDSGLVHGQFTLLQDAKERGISEDNIILSPWKMPSWMTTNSPQLLIPANMYDEAIELIAATLVRARDTYGVNIRHIQFNEPNNNGWDVYFSPTEMCSFIKKAAPRFAALGLNIKWLTGDTYDAATLVNYARPMLEDAECRQYLGPVDFHSWNSYDDAAFANIYALASQYGLPVWSEEVGTSSSDSDDRTTWAYAFNLAKMYHRLIKYARASVTSYWVYGSWNTWDPLNPSTLNPYPSFYVLKHISEDLPAGSDVIESFSSDSSVWVIAARNSATGNFSVQIINTATTAKDVDISGLPNSYFMLIRTNSQGTANLDSYQATNGGLSLSLPGESISSLRSQVGSNPPQPCGNGQCDSGECSSCLGDCTLSYCCGREGCNSGMGETCSICPQDCGSYPSQNPIAHWKFDEGSGTTAQDSSGKGNTGTISGVAAWTTGKFGNALSFDGTNDYVSVNNIAALEGIGILTVSAWAKSPDWTTGNGWMGIVSQRFPGGDGPFSLSVMASDQGADWGKIDFKVRNSSDSTEDSISNNVLNTNQWYHFVGVYNGADIALYINGVKQTSNPSLTGVTDSGGPGLYFGRQRTEYSEYFSGSIDDVRIYSYALSSNQIQTIYSGTRSDTDYDGCISNLELIAFIDKWKVNSSDVSLKELIEAIGLWKRGGC